MISALIDLDWVGRLEEPGDARYVLLCEPRPTLAEPLVAKLLLDPTPDLRRSGSAPASTRRSSANCCRCAGERVGGVALTRDRQRDQSRPLHRGAPQRHARRPS